MLATLIGQNNSPSTRCTLLVRYAIAHIFSEKKTILLVLVLHFQLDMQTLWFPLPRVCLIIHKFGINGISQN